VSGDSVRAEGADARRRADVLMGGARRTGHSREEHRGNEQTEHRDLAKRGHVGEVPGGWARKRAQTGRVTDVTEAVGLSGCPVAVDDPLEVGPGGKGAEGMTPVALET